MIFNKYFNQKFKYFYFSKVWLSGRSNNGQISAFTKGAKRFKMNYCFVNVRKLKHALFSKFYVIKFDYDFQRNPYIVLIFNVNFGFSYQIASQGMNVNSTIRSFDPLNFGTGDANYINVIPLGYRVYNIAKVESGFSKFARTSGSSGSLVSKSRSFTVVKLPSGILKKFFWSSWGLIGVPSFGPKFFNYYPKAGFNKMFGLKSVVRGVAMNPVDHPHGGGEGKKSGPSAPRSPWGWITKGYSSVRVRRKKNK
jgi:large subunit ribosomal protein L2